MAGYAVAPMPTESPQEPLPPAQSVEPTPTDRTEHGSSENVLPEGTDFPRSGLAAATTVGLGEPVKRMGAFEWMAILALFMPAVAGVVLLSNMSAISSWFAGQGEWGVAIYIVGFAVLSGFALLPTYAQAALGGYVFGVSIGVPAAMCGFLGGAIIAYELGRMSSRDRIDRMIEAKPKWAAVRRALTGRQRDGSASLLKSVGTVTLLRLPPNSPFALMNLLMSSVKVPRLPYYIGTLVGMLPRTALVVVLGAGIRTAIVQHNAQAASTADGKLLKVELTGDAVSNIIPFRIWIGGIVAGLIIVVILGLIAKRAINKVAADGDAAAREASK